MLKDLLAQIETAVDANLYLIALFASLAIPDICGAIDSEDGTASKSKYINWFNKYVADKCSFLSGEDCYYFRCSFLHQGSTQHPNSSYSRILFVDPTATTNVLHCNVFNDALNIDFRIFCKDMVEAARQWLTNVESTERYTQNIEKFVQRYPTGLHIISGLPVIS